MLDVGGALQLPSNGVIVVALAPPIADRSSVIDRARDAGAAHHSAAARGRAAHGQRWGACVDVYPAAGGVPAGP